jgi:hypothetical protein
MTSKSPLNDWHFDTVSAKRAYLLNPGLKPHFAG